MPRHTRGDIAAAGAMAAAAAVIAASRSPVLREQARFAAGLVRGSSHPPAPPVPPALPPGRVVALPRRGEVFIRDSGLKQHGDDDVPTVLLLHGWTVSADLNFFAVYQTLSRAYRVIALDHRGHGRGMRSVEPFSLEDCADDAAALLRELDVPGGRTIVLGYSMGGPIAMLLARRHPRAVAGLVSQATALEWRATPLERGKWRLLSVAKVGLRVGNGDGVVERVIEQVVPVSSALVGIRPWLEAEIQRGLGQSVVAAGRALSLFDGRPWVRELDLPAVVCVTLRDRLVPPAKQRALARALRAEVLEIDGDHDVTLVSGSVYAAVTRRAVDLVAAQLSAQAARTAG